MYVKKKHFLNMNKKLKRGNRQGEYVTERENVK